MQSNTLTLTLAIAFIMTAAVQPAMSHGGGCRKSSPPGQCCHMDKKAGVVHCHDP